MDATVPPSAAPAVWSVLLVDPQPLVRAGLRAVLEREPDFTVAGDAADADQAYAILGASNPDRVVMEAALSGLSGAAVAREILRRSPASRILVVASQLDEQAVVEALSAGVRGYVGKEQPVSEVLRALRFVAAGQSYLAPTISRYVLDQFVRMSQTGQSGPLLKLTRRERDIFHLTVRGVATGEIAQRLGISRRTVDTHRGRVMHKLDVHTTAALVRLAARLGLLVNPPEGPATA